VEGGNEMLGGRIEEKPNSYRGGFFLNARELEEANILINRYNQSLNESASHRYVSTITIA
jgi:hypothetical protein